MKIAPCKGCMTRYRACHDSCGRYATYRQKLDKVRAIRKAETDFHEFSLAVRKNIIKTMEVI